MRGTIDPCLGGSSAASFGSEAQVIRPKIDDRSLDTCVAARKAEGSVPDRIPWACRVNPRFPAIAPRHPRILSGSGMGARRIILQNITPRWAARRSAITPWPTGRRQTGQEMVPITPRSRIQAPACHDETSFTLTSEASAEAGEKQKALKSSPMPIATARRSMASLCSNRPPRDTFNGSRYYVGLMSYEGAHDPVHSVRRSGKSLVSPS